MKMDTVVKSRESSHILDCSSQSSDSCDSSSVCLTGTICVFQHGCCQLFCQPTLAHPSLLQVSQFGSVQETDSAWCPPEQRLVLRSPLSWCLLYRVLRSVARSLPSAAQLWPTHPSRLSLQPTC